MILGIDFGTCYSSIAVMVGDQPETRFLEPNLELGVPSSFLHHDGELYFGADTEAGDLHEFRNDKITGMKREIRRRPGNMNVLYPSGGRNFLLKDIVENYLKYLISKVKRTVDEDSSFIGTKEIEAITIAAPVAIGKDHELASTYNEFLQNAIHNITKLDRSKIHVFDEPSAAAVSYIYSNYHSIYDKKQTVLVFDLGGGTLDIVLLQHDPVTRDYKILDREGDLDLGGNDWDEKLSELVMSLGNKTEFTDERQEYDFKEAIVSLKVELSELDEVSYRFRGERNELLNKVVVTREMFEKVTEPLLDRAINKLMTIINNYPEGIHGIDKIITVGGSSNMPQIRNRIVKELSGNFDEEDIISWDPSKAIAKGAAIHARMLYDTDYGVMQNISSTVSHTYGIAGYHDPDSTYLDVSNVLYKGEDFKEEKLKRQSEYALCGRHGKSSIQIDVYESDVRKELGINPIKLKDDMIFSGIRMFISIPEEYLGIEEKFKVRIFMEVNSDGILRVTAKDPKTNKVYKIAQSR